MAERDSERTEEFFGQVSKEGRSYVDLENKANAQLILNNMNAYRKVKVKKVSDKRQNDILQTA